MRPLRSVVTPDHSAEGDSLTQFRLLDQSAPPFASHSAIAVRGWSGRGPGSRGGGDYESHVARLANRFLRRQLGVAATIFSSQRNQAALATLLDDAETRGNINADETDELDKTDLILTADGPTDYILAEISITIQQHDVDRAAHRAALLAKATGQTVTPFAIGAQEEPGINHRDVQVILIPEPTDD